MAANNSINNSINKLIHSVNNISSNIQLIKDEKVNIRKLIDDLLDTIMLYKLSNNNTYELKKLAISNLFGDLETKVALDELVEELKVLSNNNVQNSFRNMNEINRFTPEQKKFMKKYVVDSLSLLRSNRKLNNYNNQVGNPLRPNQNRLKSS
jgi:hypothetical protein